MTHAMHRILVVEDDIDMRKVVRITLQAEGYRVIEAATAAAGEASARSDKPDLILLDLGLPDADGATVIRRVRAWSPVPIVVLSARTMEEQKVAALDAGADDYVTKPFGTQELLARVRAGLRRNSRSAEQGSMLSFGNVHLDLEQRIAQVSGADVHLTPIEFRVMECLARNAGRIVTQQQIIREVWGTGRDSRNLRVAIKALRQKLEPDPPRPVHIVTESGVGYRLSLPVQRDEPAGAD